MSKLLPDDSPKTAAKACLLGAASSSCSYAAVALARALFRKGANFTAAMVFELASTNLVTELFIIMAILLGWQFAFAELVGAPVMVVILTTLFRLFLTPGMVEQARRQADKGPRPVRTPPIMKPPAFQTRSSLGERAMGNVLNGGPPSAGGFLHNLEPLEQPWTTPATMGRRRGRRLAGQNASSIAPK
jgi:uncharacterized membrane protein YraQ (UPF0718 family)